MITLYCFRKHCVIVPRNYILLFVFTFTEGYLVSLSTAVAEPAIVLLAAGVTFFIVFFITIYAVKTKNDITTKTTAIFYLTIAVIVMIVIASLFRSHLV